MGRFIRYQAPFLAICVSIFAVSSLETVPSLPLPFLADKIPHAVVFALLAVFARRAFRNQSVITRLAHSPTTSAFLFAMMYGAIDEFHQYFVPGRTTDIWDLVADVVGAALGLVLVWMWEHRRRGTAAAGEIRSDGV